MITVKASAEIIDFSGMGLLEQIEYCGRLCYKSEGKIKPGSAEAFIADKIKSGHKSVLEMGSVVINVKNVEWAGEEPKYINISTGYGVMLASGSPRAIREFYLEKPKNSMARSLIRALVREYPVFDIGVDQLQWSNLTKSKLLERELPPINDKHAYVGVKFVVGRNTSHELVRHRPLSILQESQRYCKYSLGKFGNQVTFVEPCMWREGSTEYKLWEKSMEVSELMYLELLKTSSAQAARTVLPNSCKTELIIHCNLPQWKHMLELRTTPACDPGMLEVMVPLKEEFERRGLI